jgi:hypothetical protein
MIKHKESHLDHGLSPDVVDYIMTRFADRAAFFIETFELPVELGTVPCGLYGPIMGDGPITDDCPFLHEEKRGTREYTSRGIKTDTRQVRTVTVIAGPHEEPDPSCDPNGTIKYACILYTAFGGPITPKEPNDPTLAPDKLDESRKFWSVHALAV